MLEIKDGNIEKITNRFPDVALHAQAWPGSWQTSRYVQFYLEGFDHDLHYEYRIDHNWEGRVELHFEGDWENKYGALIDQLMDKTQNNESLHWSEWTHGYRCQHVSKINDDYELFDTLSYMMKMFNKLIGSLSPEVAKFEERDIEADSHLPEQSGSVEMYEKPYGDILRLPLSIPDYQRIYCWEEDNVKCLLDDVFDHISSGDTPYRLGTIILHKHDGKYDIIDGQQRLVTLSLLLAELGVSTHLLGEKFTSRRSLEYVAYNKHLIHRYLQRRMTVPVTVDKLMKQLEFSVLVLQNASIDLAYTFFSNQNSRGVALTDYDLLKAHHLRYIPASCEQQSKHSAETWNRMIEKGRSELEQSGMPDYAVTLDTYIYRLRKWMRKKECDDSTDNYRVKKEYEAAPVVDEIPPFGEQFYFNEPIQGGTHFFSFVEQHLRKYESFTETEEYRIVHNELQGGSNQWYRDAIESILFGYFLKFGAFYLSDALVVIMRIILQHRYETPRANKASILRHVSDSELILIIDQATSPTFFLAETRNKAKEMLIPSRQNMTAIQRQMRMKASNISKTLGKNIVVESFKNLNR